MISPLTHHLHTPTAAFSNGSVLHLDLRCANSRCPAMQIPAHVADALVIDCLDADVAFAGHGGSEDDSSVWDAAHEYVCFGGFGCSFQGRSVGEGC